METQPLFLDPGSKIPKKSSDWPGSDRVLISGTTVVAKRLGLVGGPMWLRLSSLHNICVQEGEICHMIRIGAWGRARRGEVLLF